MKITTAGEARAYNAGIVAVLTLAEEIAAALAPHVAAKPTRFGFAVEALAGLADEGLALLLPLPTKKPEDR